MSQTKRIMISLPDNLLDEIDIIVEGEKRSRSEFIREAMRLYMQERQKKLIREKLQKGYIEMAGLNLNLANEALEAENEANKLAEQLVGGE